MILKPFSTPESKDINESVGKLVIYAEHDGEARLVSDLFKFLSDSKNLQFLVDIFQELKDNQ